MLFDSNTGTSSNRNPVLWDNRRDDKRDLIFPGGNRDPNLAVASALDIERVTALYPASAPQGNAPQQAPPGPPAPFGAPGPLGKQITKRWHSIPAGPQVWRANPMCAGYTYISYCFQDQASSRDFGDLFLRGLAKWAPALRGSGLNFVPDLACLQSPCLCTAQGVGEATLRIMLSQHGDAWPSTTLGYTDPQPGVPTLHPCLPHNFIIWPADADRFLERGALYMAQQIGEINLSNIFGDGGSRDPDHVLTVLQDML